jgi:sulfur-carrier protein
VNEDRTPVLSQEVSSSIMPIRVRVPTPLRRFTGGSDEIRAEGDSIKAVIEDLERRHPGMRERLLDDNGELRRFVNIYLNGDDIRFLNQLTSRVKDGDDISIVPAIAGGA